MKKLSYIIVSLIIAMISLAGCQDELDEKYVNPEKTTQAAIEKFFTRMLNNDRVRPSYWNVRTFLVMQPALYTQTVGFINDNKRYQQQIDYTEDRWDDYFTPSGNGSGVVAQYREIQKQYETLSDKEKQTKEVFVQAAKVVYLDQTSQMVDLWGAIPFDEAGMLNLTGEIIRPEFDDGQAIYTQILTGLAEAADYFSTISLDPVTLTTFQKQDIELGGDVKKWQRYANSLRLRLLMRTSFADEASARTVVLEMLNDPARFPLVDAAEYNVLLAPLTNYTNDLRTALTDLTNNPAPEYMLDQVLKPANDPRIPVLFDQGMNGYTAMPVDLNATEQQQGVAQRLYAVVDTATFLYNSQLPGIVITAAEVNFLKAEALLRWGSQAEAVAAYETGIRQSVDFYYYLNSLGSYRDPVPTPTEEEMSTFLSSPAIQLSGTPAQMLAKIWTQKWLHLGFMQSVEAWAEMRRTNYPQLSFVPDNSTPGYEMPPVRLTYPNSEKLYNSSNYERVANSDTRDNKIFWDVN